MERKIGAQMYTVRDYTQNAADLEKCVERLAKIGYTFGQASAFPEMDANIIREICDKYGYRLTGSHTRWDKLINDTENVIRDHKIIGCMMPGTGSAPEYARTSKDGLLRFMNEANELSDKLAAEGMTFTYHNHAFEFVRVDGDKTIMDIILECANDNFKLMVDVFWLAVAGINPVKFLRKYKDKVGGVHYKDLKVVDNAPAMCEIGLGNLEWDKICAVCDEIQPRFIYVEQDTNWLKDPFASLETSYNYLKKLGYK